MDHQLEGEIDIPTESIDDIIGLLKNDYIKLHDITNKNTI